MEEPSYPIIVYQEPNTYWITNPFNVPEGYRPADLKPKPCDKNIEAMKYCVSKEKLIKPNKKLKKQWMNQNSKFVQNVDVW